jgi:hypothetical protein
MSEKNEFLKRRIKLAGGKRKFYTRVGRTLLTKTVPGKILLAGVAGYAGVQAYKNAKLFAKALKTDEYKGKSLKEIVHHDVKKLWKIGKKKWGVDKETLKKKTKVQKKSTGGEIIIGKGVDLDLL